MRRPFPRFRSPRWGALPAEVVEGVASPWEVLLPSHSVCGRQNKSSRGRSIDSRPIAPRQETAVGGCSHPIDDIRSTARYRAAVAGNLVDRVLNRLASEGGLYPTQRGMHFRDGILFRSTRPHKRSCPAADPTAWARGMVAHKTFRRQRCTLVGSERDMARAGAIRLDASVPQSSANGGLRSSEPALERSPMARTWSGRPEQRSVTDADAAVKALWLMRIENTSGVSIGSSSCAPRVSPQPEILDIIQRRLNNDAETELHEAVEQQRQITGNPAKQMAARMKRISTHILDLGPRQACRGPGCATGEAE